MSWTVIQFVGFVTVMWKDDVGPDQVTFIYRPEVAKGQRAILLWPSYRTPDTVNVEGQLKIFGCERLEIE
jgi:hypothetical protein